MDTADRGALFTARRLAADLAALGASPGAALFERLAAAYGAPERHYHGTHHVAACLASLDRHAALAGRVAEVAVALWFHDAVYDSHRADNEVLSARWAGDYLRSHGVDDAATRRVEAMVLATATHQASTPDEALMLDIDLSILGAGPAAFARYDRDIRAEYAWVPEPDYRARRARVLGGFLARPRIFVTDPFHEALEARARANLADAIARLGG